MARFRDRAQRRSATAMASSRRTPATTPTAATRLTVRVPAPGTPVSRTSSPAGRPHAGRCDACVTAPVELADGVATVVEAAGDGVSTADWPADAVGQKSISWL